MRLGVIGFERRVHTTPVHEEFGEAHSMFGWRFNWGDGGIFLYEVAARSDNKKDAADPLRDLHGGALGSGLPAQSDTQSGEWAIEADIAGVTCVDTSIHRAEEEIGAIAEADLRFCVFERETGKATKVGHHDAARTGG